MQYRNLGSSGLKVSAIGLGTNQFGGKVDLNTTKDILSAAIDLEINFIDTANIYQDGRSEEYIGKALKGNRHKVLLATKFGMKAGEQPNERGASRMHINSAVEISLQRLGTDYIDLYQIHRWDTETPIEETMRALNDLVQSGKVRYIGASNFDAWQLVLANMKAELHKWTKFVSIQPHYHILAREIETDLIPACQHLNVGILPFFPLAGGFLTGKYKAGQAAPPGSRGESSQYVQRYMQEDNYKVIDILSEYASRQDHTLGELAHAWLLARPQICSVISGATRVEHVEMNAKSISWELSPEELSTIDNILNPEKE